MKTTTIVTKKRIEGRRAILGVFESKALARQYAKDLPTGTYCFVDGAVNGHAALRADGSLTR